MAQTVTTTTGANYELAARMIEKLEDHADTFGVGISGNLSQAMQNFLTEVIREERDESTHDASYECLTADVVNRLGEALQRLATDIEDGNF